MRRSRGVLLLGAAFLLARSPLRAAKPIPPSPASYVHNEGVISGPAAERLSARLADFETRTGRQFVVALFQSLEGEDLEDYANRLFRTWRIGSKKLDDGLLLCVFKSDRRWRVEVGYGLEPVLTDLEAAEIVREQAVPRFKAGDFDGGVEAAAGALIEKLSAPPEAGREPPRAAVPSSLSLEEDVLPLLAKVPWVLGGFFFLFWAAVEAGLEPGIDTLIGRRQSPGPRYPLRLAFIAWLYILLLARLLWEAAKLILYAALSGGSSGSSFGSGGGGFSSGGFSGGGGSSGGGGASGGW